MQKDQMKKHYRVMTDFAAQDPRSVKAYLMGHRNGQEAAWNAFCKKMRRQHPHLDDADLTERYAEHVRRQGLTVPKKPARQLTFAFAIVKKRERAV